MRQGIDPLGIHWDCSTLFWKQKSINKSGHNSHTEWTQTGYTIKQYSVNLREVKHWGPEENTEGLTSP